MAVSRPNQVEMRAIAEDLRLHFSEDDFPAYLEMVKPMFEGYDRLDALSDFVPEVRYPREPGARPRAGEDPLNAWYVKTKIRGAKDGSLSGKTVALKDNICLASVPMMNGASTLDGYVPDVDATIVTRILDAGGVILGKANCEYFCQSAGSHTNAIGPTHNPLRRGYSAGGSSSGSAAIVAAGEADMAIGGDQGGSIRLPASFCGIYGMKPTHGLVPYTGVMPMDVTLDHVGPMTRTVADNALLLEVIAGADGLDPRQYAPVVGPYREALERGVKGLSVGIVREGFGQPGGEPDVDEAVRAASDRLRRLGAVVEEVSIPMHTVGSAIWLAISAEGVTRAMMDANTLGGIGRGLYVTSLGRAHAAWRTRADELPDTMKLSMLVGHYFTKRYGGHYYAKAQNLSRQLRAAYDHALSRHDLLILPTTPMKATPLPPAEAPREVQVRLASVGLRNTSPFNCTGHPALSAPCGATNGLPIGLMIVAKHYDETTIYRAAAALEA